MLRVPFLGPKLPENLLQLPLEIVNDTASLALDLFPHLPAGCIQALKVLLVTYTKLFSFFPGLLRQTLLLHRLRAQRFNQAMDRAIRGIGFNAAKVKGGKTNYGLGGKYSFGNFALAASYNDKEKIRRGFSLGGSANFGAFTLTADVTRDTRNQLGKKYTNFLLEGKYALSKRTFVYVAGLRLNSTNNYGLGIRHNF